MEKQYKKCIISKQIQLDAIVTFHDSIYKSDFYYEGEMHDFWEVVCIIGGQAEIVAGNNVFLLQHGQAVVHPPMEFHNLRPAGGTSMQALIVSFYASRMPDLSERIFKLTSEIVEQFQLLCQRAKSFFTFTFYNGLLTSVIEGKELEASMFLTKLEYLLHRLMTDGANVAQPSRTQSAQTYQTILNVMEQNLDKKLSICELAARCSIGEANMRSIFRKYAGKGVMSYFNLMKIKKAIVYLQEGKSVKETALMLGFSDQNYFNTVFKRMIGVPPVKYKAP